MRAGLNPQLLGGEKLDEKTITLTLCLKQFGFSSNHIDKQQHEVLKSMETDSVLSHDNGFPSLLKYNVINKDIKNTNSHLTFLFIY